MTSISLKKFPELRLKGHRLIWDSRQAISGENEMVFVASDLSAEVQADLRARPKARVVDVPNPRFHLAEKCAEALGEPSRQLCVLGVTGTNGKSTTAALLRQILVQAGHRTAEIGTLGIGIWAAGATQPEQLIETGFTTPEAPTLQQLFHDLLENGVTHVVMEVSSHAAVLGRAWAIDFDGLLYTNLSQDHLDFHRTMQAYEAAKAELFTRFLPYGGRSAKKKFAVFNGSDPAVCRAAAQLPSTIKKIFFSLGDDYQLLRHDVQGTELQIQGWEPRLSSPLVGAFNAENLVAAARTAEALGLSPPTITSALLKFQGAKGRLECVSPAGQRKKVFVDFAHSPDALKKTLLTLRELCPRNAQLWLVFGCGGDRDAAKRPLMGEIAARLADRVVLTSDNPRSEDPESILRQIMAGVAPSQQSKLKSLSDRKEAIYFALDNMGESDVCVIAGKGHEEYQVVGQRKNPFSDQALCRAYFG